MSTMSRFMESLTGKRKVAFYVIIILVCVFAIGLAIYSTFFYEYSDTDPLMLGIHVGATKTSEEYAELKSNFLNLFTNEVHINSESINVDKIQTSKSIVFTDSTIEYIQDAYCDVDLKLPSLNINTNTAKEINAEIKEEFYDTANVIMRQTSQYIIYKVSYVAYVNENIVSIVIKETSKYGNNSETTRIRTYNYNITTDEEVSLSDLIELKETTNEKIQSTIDSTIQTAYENSQAISSEYGSSVVRDPDDSMYEVENTTTYFLTDDGYVYIIYAYGEDMETNEMDIIIF